MLVNLEITISISESLKDTDSELGDLVELLKGSLQRALNDFDEHTRSDYTPTKEDASIAKEARAQDEYRIPLIQALVDLGGSPPREDVFELLEERLDFVDADLARTSSGATRWKKHVEWMASKLRPKYVQRPRESGWGIWALTETGWEHASDLGLTD